MTSQREDGGREGEGWDGTVRYPGQERIEVGGQEAGRMRPVGFYKSNPRRREKQERKRGFVIGDLQSRMQYNHE